MVISFILLEHAPCNFRSSLPGQACLHLPPPHSESVPLPLAHSNPAFLYLGTADIWGQVALCRGACPEQCLALSSNPGPYPLLVGMEDGGPSKNEKSNCHRIQPSRFWGGYTPQRSESRISKRYLYICLHSSIIHKNQKVEATQVSTEGLMGKENVVYTHSRLSLSLKKERDFDTCYNIDEPRGHHAR